MEKTKEETKEEQMRLAMTEFLKACHAYRPAATQERSLGIAIAHHYRWDGFSIMETFAEALEDANYHAHCATVRRWQEQELKPDQALEDAEGICNAS